MGHSTGNDLESNDILDFSDNCENLDVLMNADQEYWTDRLGNKRPTIDYALRMVGFTPAGFDFTTGGVLKNGDRNKCVFNQADQTWYSWSGDLPYNVIAGSTPGEGWKVADGSLLRKELLMGSLATRNNQWSLRDFISVRDFGAKGDGVTDDSGAIQTAINFAGTKSTLYYPKGVYLLQKSVTLQIEQHHIGHNVGIKIPHGVTGFVRTEDGYPGNIKFEGFEFVGTDRSGKAISITNNTPFVNFICCKFAGLEVPVDLKGSYNSCFSNCYFLGNTIGALLRDETHSSQFFNCLFDYNIEAGLCINGTPIGGNLGSNTHNITIIGCGFQNSKIGAWFESTYELSMTNIYHEGNTVRDIQLGVGDGGIYNRSCYHTIINGLQTSSPCGDGVNISIEHSVACDIKGLAFNAGCSTSGTLLRTDGYCDKVTIDYHRTTTTTPTTSVPFDFGGDSAKRVVLIKAGVSLFPFGMLNAISFGDLTKTYAGLHGGYQPSGRLAMYLEGFSEVLDLVHRTAGVEKFIDRNNNDGFVINHLSKQIKTGYQLSPVNDNVISCGAENARWSEVRAGSGTIITSDQREKTTPIEIEDDVLDAWGEISYIVFKWLESIDKKGSAEARKHIGIIAQDIRDTFDKYGLDATEYGLLCYDEWEDVFEPVVEIRRNPESGEDEEFQTGEKVLVQPAGNRWGIRPDQCNFLEAKYLRRELAKNKAEFNMFKLEMDERLKKLGV